MIPIVILVVSLLLVGAVGMAWQRHQGVVRHRTQQLPHEEVLERAERMGIGSITVIHFTADWCGPCAAVRRVVTQVVDDLQGNGKNVLHLEIDIGIQPELGTEFKVMSLPTTVITDQDGHERFRINGVPTPANLRKALATLMD